MCVCERERECVSESVSVCVRESVCECVSNALEGRTLNLKRRGVRARELI